MSQGVQPQAPALPTDNNRAPVTAVIAASFFNFIYSTSNSMNLPKNFQFVSGRMGHDRGTMPCLTEILHNADHPALPLRPVNRKRNTIKFEQTRTTLETESSPAQPERPEHKPASSISASRNQGDRHTLKDWIMVVVSDTSCQHQRMKSLKTLRPLQASA
jgi:hypothetical protein